MFYKFQRIALHNFLSFEDTEITLDNRGFVLVSGMNNDSNDVSQSSNGSGKSSIFSAICYALTGETSTGATSDLKNKFCSNDDGMYVDLTFFVGEDEYEIIRSNEYETHGNNLKIFINGENKSGKGFRESQQLLDLYLPEISAENIGNTFLFAQSLPYKLSRYWPAKRKELLERLAGTEFLVEELKNKLAARKDTLTSLKQTSNDRIIEQDTKLKSYEHQLASVKKEFASLVDPSQEILDQLNKDIVDLDNQILTNTNTLNNYNVEKVNIEKRLSELEYKKQIELNAINTSEASDLDPLKKEKAITQGKLSSIAAEIEKLKNIKDICPTCGQKIPSVIRPDISPYEAQKDEFEKTIYNINEQIKSIKESFSQTSSNIHTQYQAILDDLTKEQNNLIGLISSLTKDQNILVKTRSEKEKELNRLKYDKESFLSRTNDLNLKINDLEKHIGQLEKTLKKEKLNYSEIEDRLTINTKMTSFVKREFRGILLQNVIKYIDHKLKEYSNIAYGNSNIEFILDGNYINIIYNNKIYDNLSGGEKQKVDILIQLAIRDMMKVFSGFECNILVADEVFDSLDSESCNKIIELLLNVSSSVSSMFLISHRVNELSIPYDDEIIVEKGEDGISRIIKGGN